MQIFKLSIVEILVSLFLSGCGVCNVDEIAKRDSIDGKYSAKVVERNCGATVPYLRMVVLGRSGSEFDFEDEENWVFVVRGQPKIEIEWKKGNELIVLYTASVEVRNKREKWKGVLIRYQ